MSSCCARPPLTATWQPVQVVSLKLAAHGVGCPLSVGWHLRQAPPAAPECAPAAIGKGLWPVSTRVGMASYSWQRAQSALAASEVSAGVTSGTLACLGPTGDTCAWQAAQPRSAFLAGFTWHCSQLATTVPAAFWWGRR